MQYSNSVAWERERAHTGPHDRRKYVSKLYIKQIVSKHTRAHTPVSFHMYAYDVRSLHNKHVWKRTVTIASARWTMAMDPNMPKFPGQTIFRCWGKKIVKTKMKRNRFRPDIYKSRIWSETLIWSIYFQRFVPISLQFIWNFKFFACVSNPLWFHSLPHFSYKSFTWSIRTLVFSHFIWLHFECQSVSYYIHISLF